MHGKEDENVYWFVGAIANTTAQIITHPLDLIRMLVQSTPHKIYYREVFNTILEKQGKIGLFYGLRTATQRQIVYSMMRFGFYELGIRLENSDKFISKVEIAGGSGLLAGFFCTPMEQVNVRMRTDFLKSFDKQRNYRNTYKALLSMYYEGGFGELYRCGIISSVRGMCMSIGQLAVYDQVREMLLETEGLKQNWRSCLVASLIAGSVTTFVITPVEVVKLTFMDAERKKFRCSMDVITTIVNKSGFSGLYRGIVITSFRIVPYTLLTFVFYELLRLEINLIDTAK